jgi:hypothetical protein
MTNFDGFASLLGVLQKRTSAAEAVKRVGFLRHG